MRLSLLLVAVVGGCASTASLRYAQQNVQACEYQRDRAAAAGDATGAARIEADCGWWRTQASLEQQDVEAARERRRAAGAVFHGMAEAHRAAGTAYAPRPPVSCSSQTIGSSTFTSCN